MGLDDKVIEISIALIVVVVVFAFALQQYATVDTTNWSATTILMWGMIGVMASLGVGLAFIYYAKRQKR